jgi:hypothetical protein
MKHTTKEPSAQLFCHVLVLVSVLTLTLLGQTVDSQASWFTCPPHLACLPSPPHRTNRRQSVTLHDHEYRLWCYIANSWPRPYLCSLVLAALWSLSGHRTPDHECIFHALQNAQDQIKEVYGADYADTHPQAERLRQAIYNVFDTQTKRTAQQQYEAVMACRAQYIEDTHAAAAIFDSLERHLRL